MKTTFISYIRGLSEDLVPRSQGWYVKQTKADKTSVFVSGPMTEDSAIKQVAQRGGSEKGFYKTFISAEDVAAAKKDPEAEQVQSQTAQTPE